MSKEKTLTAKNNASTTKDKIANFWNDTKKDFRINRSLYLLVLPVVAYYIIFMYVPMSGILMAFQNFTYNIKYNFFGNLIHSEFVGLDQFKSLFGSLYFKRALGNTLRISIASILIEFPAPIILALLLNEIKSKNFKKLTQTTSYLPHFISMVVVCGMVKDFTTDTGIVSTLISYITGKPAETMLNNPKLFLPVYIGSNLWQEIGWGSIIYIAALSGIDQALYEAAAIDGAGRWKQMIHVTLPGILPTIVIMLILRMGSILNVSFEKILLLSNELTWKTSEVLSTLVYRRGLINMEWSFSVAANLFNSVVNFALLTLVNYISRKTSETSLW